MPRWLWLLDRWNDFEKALTKLLGFPSHLLLQKSAPKSGQVTFFRACPEHTTSTCALVSLLVHWAARGWQKSQAWQQSVEVVLEGLVVRLLGEVVFLR